MTRIPREIADQMRRHDLTELRARQIVKDRERLRRIAGREYPGGSFGPRIRAQMAESISAHMALGRLEKKP